MRYSEKIIKPIGEATEAGYHVILKRVFDFIISPYFSKTSNSASKY